MMKVTTETKMHEIQEYLDQLDKEIADKNEMINTAYHLIRTVINTENWQVMARKWLEEHDRQNES